MNDLPIALALHVLAIVLWIGGVGFATMALLPALRHLPDPNDRIALFQAVESRFAPVARASVAVAGATGVYMLFRLDAWSWFTVVADWWLHDMVVVWIIFATLLFLLEPFLLRRLVARAKAAPQATFRRLHQVHWVLLALSLLAIAGAVAGTNGLFG
jgi:uncharacterized membrane protein